MQKKNTTILLSIIGAIIILFCTAVLFSNYTAKIPSDTVGNTAGNLNNNGLFCEHDEKVYFSNAYDNGTLYSMNADETEIKKLNNAKIQYINAGGNYLVYYQSGSGSTEQTALSNLGVTTGVFRSNLKGKRTLSLSHDLSGTVLLAGNSVYYSHYDNENAFSLRKIGLNKKNDQLISGNWLNPASCQNGLIYFNGTVRDHNLYTLNTENDSTAALLEGNIWYPQAVGDYVYYMDADSNYRICRYSLLDGSVTPLTQERVDFFNVYDSLIYYQTNSTQPALKRMNVDGSGEEIVQNGIFKDLNITSQNVYFTGFASEVPVYHTPTFGPLNVTTFDAASQAAASNMK